MNAMPAYKVLDLREKKKRAKTAAVPPPREEADEKVHRLRDGRAHVPVTMLYACLINAGTFIRLDGNKQLTSGKTTRLHGMMSVLDHELPLYAGAGKEPAEWEVDIQRGKSSSGGAVCLVRPRFDRWQIRCSLEIDQEHMPVGMAQELVTVAGRRVGIGDFRPATKGTFGMFSIVSWEAL